MFNLTQSGDDLAVYVLAANQDGIRATQDSVRRVAMGTRNDLRRIIRQRFSTAGRVWAARGFAAAIHVKKQDDSWWSVVDRSVYRKKRSEALSLAWVFDTAPVVKGRKGWVAVPIRGEAPLASSGRRYAWPSEAAAQGWELEIANVMGKPFKVILGRRNSREPWRPIYYYIPPYRAAKRLDLEGLHRKWAERLEPEWADAYDRRQLKRLPRRAA